LKLPGGIKELLTRKFQNKRREWLRASIYENGITDAWPLEINLDIPTEQEALRHAESVRAWISAWRHWKGSGDIVWSERRWRSLGTQNVPEKLRLKCPADAAAWIGETARWLRAVNRFKSLVQSWPSLDETLSRHFNVLADYDDSDFSSLSEILSWICANPDSNLYIRQVPLAGIDSKWLESRKGLVCELLAAIRGGTPEDRDFFRRCGFRPLPQLIRMRILDADLRSRFSGLSDVSAPLEEIAGLPITPAVVFIVENIQSALAFNDLKNSVVIMGLGYGVDILGKISWLHHARCIYWGDIDTHGFAILNRARSYLPYLEAVLMDEATLFAHRDLWGREKDQHAAAELPLLTNTEQMLFQSLKNNSLGQHVRLEQERIRWDKAWDALSHAALFSKKYTQNTY